MKKKTKNKTRHNNDTLLQQNVSILLNARHRHSTRIKKKRQKDGKETRNRRVITPWSLSRLKTIVESIASGFLSDCWHLVRFKVVHACVVWFGLQGHDDALSDPLLDWVLLQKAAGHHTGRLLRSEVRECNAPHA